MATIKRFEEIDAWQAAREFVRKIYDLCRFIEARRDFGLSDQIKRASVSIMANIAEGFARKGSKEFSHFLFIAKASAAEVQSHLYVAFDQNYIDIQKFQQFYEELDHIQRQLSTFIKYLNTSQ